MNHAPTLEMHPQHWAIVQRILQKHVPNHEVWGFGSRSRGAAKPYADLDLAIITDAPLPLHIAAALADDFSDSDLPYRVDILDWACTGEAFRRIVERDKRIVQECL